MNNSFKPAQFKKQLIQIFNDIDEIKDWMDEKLLGILKDNLKGMGQFFSKDELVAGYKYFVSKGDINKSKTVERRIRLKPVRSQSGVTVVTIMTKPYGCPGNCIFCPAEEGLPKSYLANEPGAQRALMFKFDPYLQTYNRLKALKDTGHKTEKIEIIILGGTWSFYPEDYRIWFVTRMFEALNDFGSGKKRLDQGLRDQIQCSLEQEKNEKTKSRCVGLSIETRPDFITEDGLLDLRKLGVTKIQMGIQSLDDDILENNRRGHTVQQSREAFHLIRQAGFKIQTHWMANLYGSDSKKDEEDYERIWDKDFRPDELKIYPTSIIEDTYLYELYQKGKYKPYSDDTLKSLLKKLMLKTPRYCRLTRVVRDIPAEYVVAGNKMSNMRQIAERELEEEGKKCECIRCREIKGEKVKFENLIYEELKYETSVGEEVFMSYRTKEDKLVGFLRLSLPGKPSFVPTLGLNAVIREVHVYGEVEKIGGKKGKSQHLGVGSSLVQKSKEIAKSKGYENISVISAVGTREYYRKLGFEIDETELYMKSEI